MHGNRKISEYAPDGRTSETIFAIPGFSPGIQQGVAISLWVKSGKEQQGAKVQFRDDLSAAKAEERRAQLLESLKAPDFNAQYQPVTLDTVNRLSFRPSDVPAHYREWPMLVDLCDNSPNNGLMEKRGGALMAIERASLERRMRAYYDPNFDWEQLRVFGTGLTEDAARFDAKKSRDKVLATEPYTPSHLIRYALRPFDNRWCYYSTVRPLWNEPRPGLWAQCWPENWFLMSRPAGVAHPEGVPLFFTKLLGDNDFLRGHAYYFPVYLKTLPKKRKEMGGQNTLFDEGEAIEASTKANLSPAARAYLAALGLPDPDADPGTAGLIWMHALAVGYAPSYLMENADGIRQDWPRVPLPDTAAALRASAGLGREIAALLDPETPVPGITAGTLRPELKVMAVVSRWEAAP